MQNMHDRTNGELDAAVIAYRANPTPEHRARLISAQQSHNAAFMREQTGDYSARQR